jgi:hypothetical protein
MSDFNLPPYSYHGNTKILYTLTVYEDTAQAMRVCNVTANGTTRVTTAQGDGAGGV